MPKNSPGRFKRKCNNPEHREWCGTEPWSDGLKLTKGVSVKLRRAFISLETGRHRIDTKTKFCTGCISLAEEKLGICMRKPKPSNIQHKPNTGQQHDDTHPLGSTSRSGQVTRYANGLYVMLAKAIYASDAPGALLDNKFWLEFFTTMRPSFQVPTPHELSHSLLDLVYSDTKAKVQDKVKTCSNVVILSQGWSNNDEGNINDGDDILKIILATPSGLIFYKYVVVESKKTDKLTTRPVVRMAQVFNTVIDEIGPGKVSAIVTDGSSADVIAAYQLMRAQDDRPKGHIQMIMCGRQIFYDVAESMLRTPTFAKHIACCKDIVHNFTNHPIPAARLKDLQHQPGNPIKTLVMPATSGGLVWKNILDMMDTLQENKNALEIVVLEDSASYHINNKDTKLNILDADFWTRNETFKDLLLSVSNALKRVEGDGATLADLVDSFVSMKNSIADQLATRSPLNTVEHQSLLQHVTNIYEGFMTGAHHASHLLHPCYYPVMPSDKFHQAVTTISSLSGGRLDEKAASAEMVTFLTKERPNLWQAAEQIKEGKLKAAYQWNIFLPTSNLRPAAEILLNIPPTTASARNFGLETVHLQKRDPCRTSVEQVGKMAYVYHNLRMLNGAVPSGVVAGGENDRGGVENGRGKEEDCIGGNEEEIEDDDDVGDWHEMVDESDVENDNGMVDVAIKTEVDYGGQEEMVDVPIKKEEVEDGDGRGQEAGNEEEDTDVGNDEHRMVEVKIKKDMD